MMTREEIQRWLDTLPAGTLVGVDEGGLSLVAIGEDAYLEVGGVDDTTYKGDTWTSEK